MTDLSGLRVLLVEDEGAVALLLEDMLEDMGCQVAASVSKIAGAFEVLRSGQCDFAILDINVAGETSYDLARRLIQSSVPIVFSTGYGNASLPDDLAGQLVLTKPFGPDDLRAAIRGALS